MNKKVTITICGHYANANNLADGQTVKTQTIYNALVSIYGIENVNICDTYKWKNNPIKMLFSCIKAAKNSTDIIMLPAKNGINVFPPLFYLLSKIYSTKNHYSVIGGWLYECIKNKKYLKNILKNFTTILVETNTMKQNLASLGLSGNVYVVPNFKNIKPISEKQLKSIKYSKPLPLCTFSRVIKEKGIIEAIEAVIKVNSIYPLSYKLDIYGQIDQNFEQEFTSIINNSPPEIQYKGVIKSDDSVTTLKKYYLLLFPTSYYTEGLPGTIIDSYAAALPILSSKWQSYDDVISDGVTGYGFNLNNYDEFNKLLIKLRDTNLVYPLKINALNAFDYYSFRHGCELLKYCLEIKK